MAYFPVLGSNEPEDIELGRLIDQRDGIANKIRYGGERHVLLFGANGSGKGTRILLPNLLDMRGARSLVVVDPKGELAAVSAPFRSQVSRVVILNPFGVMVDRFRLSRYAKRRLQPSSLPRSLRARFYDERLALG